MSNKHFLDLKTHIAPLVVVGSIIGAATLIAATLIAATLIAAILTYIPVIPLLGFLFAAGTVAGVYYAIWESLNNDNEGNNR